ncbi:hypothetical protein AXK60_02120 [Tsukamurella pseudospumae]|uniref:Uncharacterized protein n=2 Tax=Tsukamurella pseudospumae TaxID=239498 RepID=A0A138AW61_9ACTN|nr:hypothetical protein AXK60_02120 [Tsukamurella pseudospumae]
MPIDRDDPQLAHLTPVERERWIGEAVRTRFFTPDAPLPPIPTRQALDEAAARATDRARRELDEPDRHPEVGLCSDPRCAHCHMSADVPGIADDLTPLPEPDPRAVGISERAHRAAWLLPLSILIREGIAADRELTLAADAESITALERMALGLDQTKRVEQMSSALRPSRPPRLGGVTPHLLALCTEAEQVLLRLAEGDPRALDDAVSVYARLRREAGALAGEEHISSQAPTLTAMEEHLPAYAELITDVPAEPALSITDDDKEN